MVGIVSSLVPAVPRASIIKWEAVTASLEKQDITEYDQDIIECTIDVKFINIYISYIYIYIFIHLI